MEMTELPSAVDLSALAEAVAVALAAHKGNRLMCEVPRRKLAEELGITGARLTVAFTELEKAGWLTISRRAGYPSSFDVAPILRSLFADKARAHRDAFPIKSSRMNAREALRVAQRAGCRLFLDESRLVCVAGPENAIRSVIARLRTADVIDSVEAWLQERDLGDAPVVYAAARLLAP